MIIQIIGWFCIIFAILAAFESGKAGWKGEDVNTEAEICFPLFLIAAAICFK